MTALLKQTINNYKYYLFLLLIALVVYWPLAFQVFTLKGDAITYFLPWRYHVSEAIQHGYFPFWSPYLYTGLPLHADIQSGVWNPVVLLISLITTYNMSVLELETFLYIIIGGIGFFKLCRFFQYSPPVCLISAVAYMSSGFMIDSSAFIPWITSAGYLPFVLLYFLQLINKPNFSYTIKLAVSLLLLFSAGYPSYFIVTAYIIAISVLVQLIVFYKNGNTKIAISLFKFASLTALLFVVMASLALVSYIEFLPYYARGGGASLKEANFNPFHPYNSISYLFPTASYKLSTQNDIAFKNAYIGIFSILFFLYFLKLKYNSLQKTVLILTGVLFLVSLGNHTPVRALLYYTLPLMNSFRHPGTMRLFTGIGILLLSGAGLNAYIQKPQWRFIKHSCFQLIAIIGIVIIYAAAFTNSLLNLKHLVTNLQLNAGAIKSLLNLTSFSDWILILGVLQAIFLIVIYRAIKHHQIKLLTLTSIVNMIVLAWLSFPFTMFSQYKAKDVNGFLNTFEKGFPMETLREPVENSFNNKSAVNVFGYQNFYRKKISIQDHIITPTINTKYTAFLIDSSLRMHLSRQSFVYLEDTSSINYITMKKFTPNYFEFDIMNTNVSVLHVIQQYNHNWKAFANGKPLNIQPSNIAFMKVVVPEGGGTVQFIYRPVKVIIAACISLFTILICLAAAVYFKIHSKNAGNNNHLTSS